MARKASQRTQTGKRRVAIILDLDWPYRRQTEVFEGINEYAATHQNWDCALLPIAEDVSTDSTAVNTSRGMPLPFEGIIARATPEMAEQANQKRIPIVNVWWNSPATGSVPTVAPDYGEVGRRAARHLIARGFRKLGYLGFLRDRACREQFSGMREVAKETGAGANRLLVRTSYNRSAERWAEFQSQLHAWIDTWPMPFGFSAASDLLARYVAEACRQRNLRIPEDVAILGCGDELPICLRPEPALSSIDCGYKETGYRAAELLDSLMDGGPRESTEERLDDARVIPRHSTDVFAVEDPFVSDALRFISEHCHESITVKDVVDHVPASRRSLERRFAKVIDRTIAEEINRMRIQHLERLLVESDEPLEALASRCGFSDTGRMRQHFVRIRGVNPSEYRRRFQNSSS